MRSKPTHHFAIIAFANEENEDSKTTRRKKHIRRCQTKAFPPTKSCAWNPPNPCRKSAKKCGKPPKKVSEILQKIVRKAAKKCWKFSQKMQEIPPKKCRKTSRKSVQKVTVRQSEMVKTMEKQVHFCPRAPRALPGKSYKNWRKPHQKSAGKLAKSHRKCSKAVQKITENSAGNHAKKLQKSGQKQCRKTYQTVPAILHCGAGYPPKSYQQAAIPGRRPYRPQKFPQFF